MMMVRKKTKDQKMNEDLKCEGVDDDDDENERNDEEKDRKRR